MSIQKGRVEISSEYCKGCGICFDACPKNLLSASNVLAYTGLPLTKFKDSGECIACKRCAIVCPESAITVFKEDEE
jgi:2-oxoglutarate ferredoxin oxidoreductase subunit delta